MAEGWQSWLPSDPLGPEDHPYNPSSDPGDDNVVCRDCGTDHEPVAAVAPAPVERPVVDHSAAYRIADEAIALFLEYRDVHGYPELNARAAAALDVAEGASVDLAALEAEAWPPEAAEAANEENRREPYFSRIEAQRFVGMRYRTVGPYSGIPRGTIGLVTGIYAVDVAEERFGLDITWEGLRPASPAGASAAAARTDGFSRADVYLRFTAGPDAGRRAIEPLDPEPLHPPRVDRDLGPAR